MKKFNIYKIKELKVNRPLLIIWHHNTRERKLYINKYMGICLCIYIFEKVFKYMIR